MLVMCGDTRNGGGGGGVIPPSAWFDIENPMCSNHSRLPGRGTFAASWKCAKATRLHLCPWCIRARVVPLIIAPFILDPSRQFLSSERARTIIRTPPARFSDEFNILRKSKTWCDFSKAYGFGDTTKLSSDEINLVVSAMYSFPMVKQLLSHFRSTFLLLSILSLPRAACIHQKPNCRRSFSTDNRALSRKMLPSRIYHAPGSCYHLCCWGKGRIYYAP
jgi:hypothetical protein